MTEQEIARQAEAMGYTPDEVEAALYDYADRYREADIIGAHEEARRAKVCQPHCDFLNPVSPRRAVWLCRTCGRDYSLEYLYWYEATRTPLNPLNSFSVNPLPSGMGV